MTIEETAMLDAMAGTPDQGLATAKTMHSDRIRIATRNSDHVTSGMEARIKTDTTTTDALLGHHQTV